LPGVLEGVRLLEVVFASVPRHFQFIANSD
jgi:hypothetical protein